MPELCCDKFVTMLGQPYDSARAVLCQCYDSAVSVL